MYPDLVGIFAFLNAFSLRDYDEEPNHSGVRDESRSTNGSSWPRECRSIRLAQDKSIGPRFV